MSKKLLTLFALTSVLFAKAQTDSTATKLLDDVVVTATKFPVKTATTGKVITIITKTQLEKAGGKDLAQIINEQASIYINGANSNAGKDKSIYLRGAAIQHTLICIDGIPTYDASGIGSNFDIRNISIDLIERVEILKGSQSTLYGSDAIAGVINIITKKENTNKPITVNALASYGTYNTTKGSIGIDGKLNNNLSYNLGYSYFKTNGINEATNNSANADNDDYKQEIFNANFNINATKNFTIQPFLRYTWLRGSVDQEAFVDELDYTYTQKSFATGIKNRWQIGKHNINILYGFNNIERHYTDDSTLSKNGFNIYSHTMYSGKEHFVDVFANIICNKYLKLTVGTDYRTSTTNNSYTSLSAWGAYNSSLQGDSVKQNQNAIYTALHINNNKGFNVEMGGRYNHHSIYGNNWVYNINPSYNVNDDVKIFANISTAYRTPSLYQLYSEYGNKNLKPEVAFTTELGLHHYFNDKTIALQTVAFLRKIKDVHFFYYNSSTFASQYINQDKQNVYGLEIEATVKPSSTTTIKAFYTAIAGYVTTKNAAAKDTTYYSLLRKPANVFSINLSSNITKKIFASCNWQWFDKRNDEYYDNTTFTNKSVILNAYSLFDVYVDYSFTKKIKAFVNVQNAANTGYTEVSGYNTLGRTFTIGARCSF